MACGYRSRSSSGSLSIHIRDGVLLRYRRNPDPLNGLSVGSAESIRPMTDGGVPAVAAIIPEKHASAVTVENPKTTNTKRIFVRDAGDHGLNVSVVAHGNGALTAEGYMMAADVAARMPFCAPNAAGGL